VIHSGEAEGQPGDIEIHVGAEEGYLGAVETHPGAWSHGFSSSITVAHPRAIEGQPGVIESS